MFKSFFPSPKTFFISAVIWSLIAVLFWFFAAKDWGQFVGLENPPDGEAPTIGVSVFWSKPFIWFYLYFLVFSVSFAAVWWWLSPGKWFGWSVLGSILILFVTYFQVEVDVAINNWFGPFYDLLQAALGKTKPVTIGEFVTLLLVFTQIALVAVVVAVLTRFFVNHYIFRWRTAMNEHYIANWPKLKAIEGASQRVQDDTMRFAKSMEDFGVSFLDALMTLIAFLPVLHGLERAITELPIIGAVPYPLVTAAILWSIFGTALMSILGIKLPGIQFSNQRVEAAYRKELVLGEEKEDRAQPQTLAQLFDTVRKNYFRMYFHYLYFNAGRSFYLQLDTIIGYILMLPAIVAGSITLGPLNQILRAFGRVRSSFLFLVNSWTSIIELISIYKRLQIFEHVIDGKADVQADEQYGLKNT